MYVCICRQITDSEIKQAVNDGATCINSLNKCIGKPTECGSCIPQTQQIIEQSLQERN